MANTTNQDNALILHPELVNGLQCLELRENVVKMAIASRDMENNLWTYAIAVHNIKENEYYRDDYKTFSDFAKAVGSDKSTFSKYVNAVSFIVSDKATKYGFTTENMTYGKVYLLSALGDDFTAFMKAHKKIDFVKATYKYLYELIKEWKKKETVETESEEVNEETESEEVEIELPKNSILATIENGLMRFTYRKKEYIIPVKELKQYQLKEEED